MLKGLAELEGLYTLYISYKFVLFFRMRQETKHLTKTYSTMDRNSQTYYRPVNFDPNNPGMTLDPMDQAGTINKDGIWDKPRDHVTSYPEQCTCGTLPGEERQSIYNSIKST